MFIITEVDRINGEVVTKIININTGKVKQIETFDCSICNCKFTEEEGGLQQGVIGMILISFCPTCFSGILDMADYFRGTDDEEE